LIADAPLGRGWTASGEILGVSSRKSVGSTVSGFGIVNMKVRSPAHPKLGQVSLAAYNVTDRTYHDPSNTALIQRSIEQSGRQLLARWEIPF